jgi:uncharacterized protein (DUF1697 family)
MPRFIALLRGVNVGGNTMIKMTDLKAAFDKCGFENVVTYINSGNVAFDCPSTSVGKGETIEFTERRLSQTIELAIEAEFGKSVPLMIRPQDEISRIIASNPFAGQFESHKQMHVLFLREEMPDDKVAQLLDAASPPERFAVVGREIYCQLPMGVADSLLGKGFIDKKLKVAVTARTWLTVERIASL